MNSRIIVIVLAALASGCAPLSTTQERPVDAKTATGPPTVQPEATAPPSATGQLMRQGRAQMAMGRNTEAAALLERALRIEPSNPWLWLELANAYEGDGDLSQAEAHARRAMSVAGDDAEARESAQRFIDSINRR